MFRFRRRRPLPTAVYNNFMSENLIKLDSQERLDALFAESHRRPIALFKHSDTCGISSHILELVTNINGSINVVTIQESRALSNEIAERTGHQHQSPQAFVIRNGVAVYHATHYGIDPAKIEENLNAGS